MAARGPDVETLLDRALRALETNRLSTAERTLGRAAELAPDDPRVVEATALLMTLLDRPDEARAAYERACRLAPENPKNRFFLARLYEREGREADAAALLDAAVELCRVRLARSPADLEAAQDLARLHAHRGEHDRALLAVFRGLAASPRQLDLLRLLVQAGFNLSHFGQAVRDAEAALARHPDDPVLLLYKGLAEQKLNLPRAALASLTASLAADPRQPELKRLIRRLKVAIARLGETVEEALAASPRGPALSGRVKWFRDETGIGALQGEDGREYFVHYLAIEKAGYQALREAEEVRFVPLESSSGPLAARIRPLHDARRPGVVRSFDPDTGTGEVEREDGKVAWLHVTAILGVGVRLVAPGDRVRFEVFESEHGPQAFNIERVVGSAADDGDAPEDGDGPAGRAVGLIVEYDADQGFGLIDGGGARVLFRRDDVRSGVPRAGARCRYRAESIEALAEEGVLKAGEIEIEPD